VQRPQDAVATVLPDMAEVRTPPQFVDELVLDSTSVSETRPCVMYGDRPLTAPSIALRERA
jgi:hypothetical protein